MGRGRGLPPKTSPLPICVVTSNFVLRQSMYAETEGTPKLGSAALLQWVHSSHAIEIRPFPTCVTLLNLVVLGQTILTILVIKEICPKK